MIEKQEALNMMNENRLMEKFREKEIEIECTICNKIIKKGKLLEIIMKHYDECLKTCDKTRINRLLAESHVRLTIIRHVVDYYELLETEHMIAMPKISSEDSLKDHLTKTEIEKNREKSELMLAIYAAINAELLVHCTTK